MPRSVFSGMKLRGVAAAVPEQRVNNLTDHAFSTPEDARKVVALTGVPEYRRAPVDMCASDLCEAAARRLMQELGLGFRAIDAIIFASMTPDFRVPSTACVLQDRLGCSTSVVAYDINMGCSAYIVGLYNACALIQAGALKRVLLLTGDTQTRLCHPEDKNVAFLLADGGTATLLEADDDATDITIELRTDGGRFENLYVPAGGFRRLSDHESREVRERADGGFRADDHLYMNGMEIFKFSSSDVVETLGGFMSDAQLAPDDVDWLFLHQANKFMTDKIASKLKFPKQKVPYSLGLYGNTGSASIPLTITHHFSRNPSPSSRSLLCGFGVGLSWGVADVRLEGVATPAIVELPGRDRTPRSSQARRVSGKVAFLFPGQGSQRIGMGREFYERFSEARELFARGSKVLGFDVAELCFDGPENTLVQTVNVQPAVTLVNMVCLHVARAHGIEASAAAGHSLGEYAALYAAGVLSFEQTLEIVRRRGQLMQEAADRNPGGMLAVMGLPIEHFDDICARASEHGPVEVANHNSGTQVILTGSSAGLEAAAALSQQAGAAYSTPLKVSGPWHSSFMRAAAQELETVLDRYRFSAPSMPVVSNVTGNYHAAANDIPPALVRQVASPVRWLDSVHRLIRDGHRIFVELGPGAMLAKLVRDIDRDVKVTSIETVEALEALQAALAEPPAA